MISELPKVPGGFRTVYADPPWPEYGGGKTKRGADRHYPLMEVDDIMKIPVKQVVADNAYLFLWVTNNFLHVGLHVMESWGFTYKNHFVWFKLNSIGLGYYIRGAHELCLFGTRGSLHPKYKDFEVQYPEGQRRSGTVEKWGTDTPTTVLFEEEPVIVEEPTVHSAKPLKMYEIIETLAHPPYLEMFARYRRKGWVAWGNQVPDEEEVPTTLEDLFEK